MEPVSTAVSGYLLDKVTDLAEGAFRKYVIERWTRKRAIEFYREFCRELLDGGLSGAELESRLEDLLSDERNSEIVWEAYRLVSLSKSKTIGPRIVAVVVAQIVQRDGIADDEEKTLLQAAELLSDDEFMMFYSQITQMQKSQSGGSLSEVVGTQSTDSSWLGNEIEIGPIALADEYGLWAEKLSRLGLITQSARQSHHPYRQDSERHIDSDGVLTKYVFTVTFNPLCVRLLDLVASVKGERAP